VVQFCADGTDGADGGAGADRVFGPDSVGALAFAARATSSFPGAFPPVSLGSFADELDGRPFQAEPVEQLFRRRYVSQHGSSATVWFVDGGVLDNAPFDLVIEAIGRKRAQSEVVRRLVYIQPDPGLRLSPGESDQPDPHGAPGYLAALLRGASTVKGSHSILRDLEGLRDLNLRISELGAIADQQMDLVEAAIDQAWAAAVQGPSQTKAAQAWSVDDRQDVVALADSMYAAAPGFAGAGFSSYCRLKVEAAGARLADEVVARFVYPPGSSRSSFVRAAISAWARGRVEWRQPDPARLMELLGPVDVPYRERRLMFILSGINALYDGVDQRQQPTRAALDALKSRAWQMLEDLRAAPREAVAAVPDAAVGFLGADLSDQAVFSRPEAFASAHDADFTTLFTTYRTALAARLADSSTPIWQGFVELTAQWPEADRRGLLSRYLGFPLWDSLIFPTVALSSLPQFSPITVSQFSPLTAMALPTPEGGKLKGVSLHHFGGFIDASWRENDYLWGRLDAAELLLRMLRSSGPGHEQAVPADAAQAAAQAGPRLKGALSAILAAEQDLRQDPTLVTRLAADVARVSA
jgi:patatin-related protein